MLYPQHVSHSCSDGLDIFSGLRTKWGWSVQLFCNRPFGRWRKGISFFSFCVWLRISSGLPLPGQGLNYNFLSVIQNNPPTLNPAFSKKIKGFKQGRSRLQSSRAAAGSCKQQQFMTGTLILDWFQSSTASEGSVQSVRLAFRFRPMLLPSPREGTFPVLSDYQLKPWFTEKRVAMHDWKFFLEQT